MHEVCNYSVDDPRLLEKVRAWHKELGPSAPIYTDPPWGDRLLKMFDTVARKHSSTVPKQTTELLMLDALAGLVNASGAPGIAMLYGNEGWQRAHKALQSVFPNTSFVDVRYEGMRPCKMLLGGSMQNDEARRSAENTQGLDRISAVIGPGVQASGATWVLEPFAGTGGYSRRLAALGVRVLANEFDPKKADKSRKALGL